MCGVDLVGRTRGNVLLGEKNQANGSLVKGKETILQPLNSSTEAPSKPLRCVASRYHDSDDESEGEAGLPEKWEKLVLHPEMEYDEMMKDCKYQLNGLACRLRVQPPFPPEEITPTAAISPPPSSTSVPPNSPLTVSIPAPRPESFMKTSATTPALSEIESRRVLHPRHPPPKSAKLHTPPIPRKGVKASKNSGKRGKGKRARSKILTQKNHTTGQLETSVVCDNVSGSEDKGTTGTYWDSPLTSLSPSSSPMHDDVGEMNISTSTHKELFLANNLPLSTVHEYPAGTTSASESHREAYEHSSAHSGVDAMSMDTGNQENSLLANSLPSPPLSEESSDLEYVEGNSPSSIAAIQGSIIMMDSPPPPIETMSSIRSTQADQSSYHFGNEVLDFVTSLANPSQALTDNFSEEEEMLVDRSTMGIQTPSPLMSPLLAFPVQATLSAASNALVEIVFRRLNHAAQSAVSPEFSTSPLAPLVTQFFDTSTIPAQPYHDLYLSLRQKSAPELRELLAQLSQEGPVMTPLRKPKDNAPGKIGYHNIPRPIADNWDAIVEAALWLRGNRSEFFNQPSSPMGTSSDSSSEEVDQLDAASMDIASSPSLRSSDTDIEEGEILIFDGTKYVPIDTPSVLPQQDTPPRHLSISSSQSSPSLIPADSPPGAEQPPIDNVRYYEKKTSKPDPWGHNDANTWFVYTHGEDSTPILQPDLDQLPPPPGHPTWCAQNRVPVIRYHFTLEFPGLRDNHPLRAWDNQILAYTARSGNLPHPFSLLMAPFIKADNLIRSSLVEPKDWRGKPDTANRKEIRNKVWKAHQVRKHNLKQKSPSYSALGISQLSSSHRTKKDSPARWADQPLGQEGADSFFTDFYPNPYEHSNDNIAFNPWNPQIIDLRQARYYLNEGFLDLSEHLLTPEIRDFVDTYDKEDDTRHFFYCHCPFFRYLDSAKTLHIQGFSCECIHRDATSLTYPHPIRVPMTPRNPLLTPEEDEFLHHAAYVFESMERFEVANALRRVRAAVPFMSKDAYILFEAGYLTPVTQYDNQGAKYPLLWDTPSLSL